jgi:hypothetical protein
MCLRNGEESVGLKHGLHRGIIAQDRKVEGSALTLNYKAILCYFPPNHA